MFSNVKIDKEHEFVFEVIEECLILFYTELKSFSGFELSWTVREIFLLYGILWLIFEKNSKSKTGKKIIIIVLGLVWGAFHDGMKE